MLIAVLLITILFVLRLFLPVYDRLSYRTRAWCERFTRLVIIYHAQPSLVYDIALRLVKRRPTEKQM